MIKKGRIYSFFATSEEIHAPFIIHAPFKLNSGRTKIDSQSQGVVSRNKWFLRTKKETMEMVRYVYERLAELQGNKIRYYIPEDLLVNKGCALSCWEMNKRSILNWNIFEDVNGNHLPASEVCTVDYEADEKELIEIHRLLGNEKSLLKIPANEVSLFGKFNIENIENVRDKLLKRALLNQESAVECLKYIEDYEPNATVRNLTGAIGLSLNYEQLVALSKYAKICAWINRNTFIFIKNKGSNSTRIYTDYSGEEKSVAVIDSFCEEYGEAVNKQFAEYLNRVNYYEVNFNNTVYTYNAVFGKNMLEDFAEAYHMFEPNDKFFYPFLRIEAVSEEIDHLCDSGESISDYEFLKHLGVHRKNQKNMLKNQYNSILELIEKSGTGTERFFPEILQNIDDCIFGVIPHATIRCDKVNDDNKLYVEYNEIGFTREQVRAITAIGDSTKKKLLSASTTGEKGGL